MAYQFIDPTECIGDSLLKINNNAANFDTRIDTVSARVPSRVFNVDPGGRIIYIDSLFGNDATANGTEARPFATIAAAAAFYGRRAGLYGAAPIFQLQGTTLQPRVYRGAHLYFNTSHTQVSVATRADNPTFNAPNMNFGTGYDRTMYIRGNVNDPGGVIIESFFNKSRAESLDFWNSHGLYVEYQGGALIVEGITFRYNAINNLPGYTGSNQFFSDKTDFAAHLSLNHMYYASVRNCVFGQMIDPNILDVGYTQTATQASRYMYGLSFHNVFHPRISKITATGSMRYLVKCGYAGDGIYFEPPGVIELQNNPNFYSFFEVELGGGIIIDPVTSFINNNLVTPYEGNYTLKINGTLSAPKTINRSWWNFTYVHFEAGYTHPGGKINFLRAPTQNSSPPPPWPVNTNYRSGIRMYDNTYGYRFVPVNDAGAGYGTLRNV